MSDTLNALQHASSAYLRSAMHQPVQWNEWGTAAFALAQQQNKPILLDSGAVWCHWCHVMDRESYENPEIAAIINERFVAVKIDRDERPDVDSRYQTAVQAITGQGGWPLTAFLTPDGRPFFGGTYFPPDDRYGRAGFKRVLMTLSEAYRTKPNEVEEQARMVMSTLSGEVFEGRAAALDPRMIDSFVQSAVKQFDSVHGGFGSQPKFPHPSAMDLLIDRYARSGDEKLRVVVEMTLTRMAQGGVYDQLGGGFHRYSVDDKWIVPHFEKMSYDNSELLRNYVHAFQVFGDDFYADVANDIIRWMDAVLSDREHGGFYASQDADINLDDDGDYFTWTVDELRSALDPREAEIAAAYYDVEAVGEMHHNPAKNVLFIASTLDQLATRFRLSGEELRAQLQQIKRKMLEARSLRPTPFVDKTVYVSWNGLCISAYLEAARALGRDDCKRFALKSLDRVLAEGWTGSELAHVIAYNDGTVPRSRMAGTLDDYAFIANACISAFELTADARYFEAARAITRATLARFYDEQGGGFFDADHTSSDKIGALSANRKPLQDTPTPAGNPSAAIALARLYAFDGDHDLLDKARRTLETFAGVAEHFGYFASTYALGLAHVLEDHNSILVLGSDASAERMYAEAVKQWNANTSVLRLADASRAEQLPPALREIVAPLLQTLHGASATLLCSGTSCRTPLRDAEELRFALAETVRPLAG
ncbi:MAG TPA: thioredoxin domain-containing protein [Terriglobales bacterium]